MRRLWFSLLGSLIVIPFILPGCAGKPEIIERKCSSCHKSSVVYQKKRPMDEWKRLVHGMEARGLKVTEEEKQAILEILAKDYSTKE